MDDGKPVQFRRQAGHVQPALGQVQRQGLVARQVDQGVVRMVGRVQDVARAKSCGGGRSGAPPKRRSARRAYTNAAATIAATSQQTGKVKREREPWPASRRSSQTANTCHGMSASGEIQNSQTATSGGGTKIMRNSSLSSRFTKACGQPEACVRLTHPAQIAAWPTAATSRRNNAIT